jgi:hypothetical protein
MPNLCIFPARALEDDRITDADLRVLAAIGIYTDRDGAGCFANASTLFKRARVSRSTFFAATKRLLEAGLIERTSGQLRGRSSDYSVCLDSRRVSGQPDSQVSSQPDSGVRPEPDSPTITAPFNDSSSPEDFLEPGFLDDWIALSAKVEKAGGSITSWRAECRSALQGMHLPKPATPAQVSQGIRHFAGNGAEVNLRLFSGYLRSIVAPKPDDRSSGKPGGKNGPSKPGWLVRKEQDDEDAVLNRDPATKKTVDEFIATRGQKWWSRMKDQAKSQDRFVYPVAFQSLKQEGVI